MHNPEDTALEVIRQSLSASMDGQATPAELDATCAAWRENGSARQAWHTYHLIGDALRSDELASTPTADEDFLQQLRRRLAHEPMALPGRPQAALLRSSRWPWATVAAVAGFVTVAAVMVVTRQMDAQPSTSAVQASTPGSATDLAIANGQLVRNAEMERYFAAHRRVAMGAAVVMPGAVVRNVEAALIEGQ